jgi:hypothetical protein
MADLKVVPLALLWISLLETCKINMGTLLWVVMPCSLVAVHIIPGESTATIVRVEEYGK